MSTATLTAPSRFVTTWRSKWAARRARVATTRQAVADVQAAYELETRHVPRWSRVPAFEQTVSATGTRPNGGPIADVDLLIAELDLLALPITTGIITARSGTVFESAIDAGHDEPCAVRQHMGMTSACTCGAVA